MITKEEYIKANQICKQVKETARRLAIADTYHFNWNPCLGDDKVTCLDGTFYNEYEGPKQDDREYLIEDILNEINKNG